MLDKILKKKPFDAQQEQRIIAAIQKAERECSGEIRLFVETFCKKELNVRTVEVFKELAMHKTRERNGVLIYIALDDRKFAIFGDEGIHQKLGFEFWQNEVAKMRTFFKGDDIVGGICAVVAEIGAALKTHFPHQKDDKNELPDAPVYGE